MSVVYTLQITTVYPGTFGGAIFSGKNTAGKESIRCRAAHQTLHRIPQVGEFWQVEGRWEDYQSKRKTNYIEKQLVLEDAQLVGLPTANYVKNFLLKHPAFRGFYFGEKKIDKLVERVGNDELVRLLNEGNTIHLSDELNPDIAKRLVSAWLNQKDEVETITFLAEHDFDQTLAKKVISLVKRNTVSRLKRNPYALICFHSISRNIWGTVEKCAAKMGIESDDPRRLQAAIELTLYEMLQHGHSTYPVEEVISLAEKRLRTRDRAIQGIELALQAKSICVFVPKNSGIKFLQLIGVAYIENSVSNKLNSLLKKDLGSFHLDLFGISKIEVEDKLLAYNRTMLHEVGYPLTDEQSASVITSLTNRCSIITGYSGTGKTTALKAISEIAQVLGKTVYGMALSGKAKVRLAEATGLKTTTIHAFIKMHSQLKSNKGQNPVELNDNPVVILDEASMVDVALFNKLLTIFHDKPYSLILVGDPAQISPVGFGLVFHELVKSSDVPKTELTIVHRQTEKSLLHMASMMIREGIAPPISEWNGERDGIYFIDCKPDSKSIQQTFLNIKLKVGDIQIVSPHASGRMVDSGIGINNHIQRNLLPDPNRNGFKVGKSWIKIGDPVIVTENNYDVELFNGTTGILLSIETNEDGLPTGKFEFNGDFDEDGHNRTRLLTLDTMLDLNLKLAYCISIHKSQGSEFDAVAVSCVVESPIVERSLLYTAITRSKRLCLIVGNRELFNKAVIGKPRAETLHVGIGV